MTAAGSNLAIRPASIDDLPAIATRIRYWADRRVLLPIDTPDLTTVLPAFRVLTSHGSGDLLAFGSLRRYSARLAEIRSLVVADGHQGRGLGRRLVGHLLDEAAQGGVRRVFVLTRSPGLFERLGFVLVPRETLPEKVYSDCNLCARRTLCDEAALVKELP